MPSDDMRKPFTRIGAGHSPDWRFVAVSWYFNAVERWQEPVAQIAKMSIDPDYVVSLRRAALMEKVGEIARIADASDDPAAELAFDEFMAAQSALSHVIRGEARKAILGSSGVENFRYACKEKVSVGTFKPVTLHRSNQTRDEVPFCLPLSGPELNHIQDELENYIKAGESAPPRIRMHFLSATRYNYGELSGKNPNISLRRRDDDDGKYYPPRYRGH